MREGGRKEERKNETRGRNEGRKKQEEFKEQREWNGTTITGRIGANRGDDDDGIENRDN